MGERGRERERGMRKDDKCIQDIQDRDAYGTNGKDALCIYIYIYTFLYPYIRAYIYIYARIYRDEQRPRI